MSLSSHHLNKDGQKNNGKSCPNEKWGGRDDAHAEVEKVKKMRRKKIKKIIKQII